MSLYKKNLFRTFFLILGFLFINFDSLTTYADENSFKNNNLEIDYLNNNLNKDYILGPGDVLNVELVNLEELNSVVTISMDGTINLPRLRNLFVSGLTLKEMRNLLILKYGSFIKEPDLEINLVDYRPIRIFIKGEVMDQGLHTLEFNSNINPLTQTTNGYGYFPSLYNVIQKAGGITPYSDLSNVSIYRINPKSEGGGFKFAKIDFLKSITEVDSNVNLRVYDQDTIYIPKADKPLRDQLIKLTSLNLNPKYIDVFITGNVPDPGKYTLKKGTTLEQAILVSGGKNILAGNIEFVRLNNNGTLDNRSFSHSKNAEIGSNRNPILMSGDIIRVKNSLFNSSVGILNEISSPFVGIYSLFSLFN